jgi:hypothetical protein
LEKTNNHINLGYSIGAILSPYYFNLVITERPMFIEGVQVKLGSYYSHAGQAARLHHRWEYDHRTTLM